MSADEPQATGPLTVMVYSDDRTVRSAVRLALGKRVAADLPELEIVETATPPALVRAVRAGGLDVLVLDGEATPAGGMGLSHEFKDSIPDCPPVVLLVARVADAWLASWSQADAVVAYPIDPVRLPKAVADVLRARQPQRAD